MRSLSKLLILFLLVLGCKKKDPEPSGPDYLSNGILVLNEGLFQQNNSSISWIDLSNSSISNDFFLAKNDRHLGDTGNDMVLHGGKIYVVVNGSGLIDVLNKNSVKSIKQIPMLNGGINKSPRSIVFSGSKGYISCYDGYVDVLDTASLTITQRIPVGKNPEDLVVSNGKLFVSNSGGLYAPVMDSTVSVIDLASLTEIQRITVGKNPGRIEVDQQGDIYVITRGNYGAIPARMVRIDANDWNITQQFDFDAFGIEKMNENFLITYYNFNTQQSAVRLFDPLSETLINNNFIPMDQITTLYGVKYDPYRNKIYCLDAMSFTNTGYVRRYSASGLYETSFKVGLNPNNLVFYE
jgi:YVTN family beta-propeller protein